VTEHPLLDLLHGANPFIEGLSNRKLTQTYIDLVGEAFWIKERNEFGMPVQVWPIPPDWVLETPTPGKRHYVVSFRAWRGEIPDTEILWFCDPNPENPYGRGSGYVRSLGDELETDEYAAKHTKSWFYNSARPDMIISADGLEKDETARLENDWLNKHQGFWRSFKPHFLNRKVDVQMISQEFRNMQLIELRKHERDTIVQVLGVPPEMLGILTSSNRATIDAADFLFSRWVVLPRLEFMRSVMQTKLVPEYDERLILDFHSPIAEDKEFILNAAKAAPWSLTLDEWRLMQSQKPLEDDAGKVHMVPLNLLPTRIEGLDTISDRLLPPTPPPEIESLNNGNGFHKQELPVDLDLVDDESFELTHVVANKLERKMELVFISAVRQARLDMDAEAVGNAIVNGNATAAEKAIPLDGFEEKLRNAKTVLRQAFTAAAEGAVDVLPAEVFEEERSAEGVTKQASFGFDTVNPRAVAWVEGNTARLVRDVSNGTMFGIRLTVRDAIEQGQTVDAVSRQIRPMIGLTEAQIQQGLRLRQTLIGRGITGARQDRLISGFTRKAIRDRARIIARTELIAAANAGQNELWLQARDDGLIERSSRKKWITTPDDRADPNCLVLDGEEVQIDRIFSGGVGAPPLHPQCRCAMRLIPGIPGRRERVGGLPVAENVLRAVDDTFSVDDLSSLADRAAKGQQSAINELNEKTMNVVRKLGKDNPALEGFVQNNFGVEWNGSSASGGGLAMRGAANQLWGGQMWVGSRQLEGAVLRTRLRVNAQKMLVRRLGGNASDITTQMMDGFLELSRIHAEATYDITQRILTLQRKKTVTLFRGMKNVSQTDFEGLAMNEAFNLDTPGSLSSYSSRRNIARSFTSSGSGEDAIAWGMKVDRKNVLSYNQLGIGVDSEAEWVVIGDKTTFDAKVISIVEARGLSVSKANVQIKEDPDRLQQNQDWLRTLAGER